MSFKRDFCPLRGIKFTLKGVLPEEGYMNLSSNLKILMDDSGISLVDLAKKTKVPKQTIHNWLSGADPKNIDQVKSVAEFFHLSIEELVYGAKKKTSNGIKEYEEEINAGVFEVVLRRIRK